MAVKVWKKITAFAQFNAVPSTNPNRTVGQRAMYPLNTQLDFEACVAGTKVKLIAGQDSSVTA